MEAIRANPDDVAAKGAYADWLDERAESAHAQPGDAAFARIVRHEAVHGRREHRVLPEGGQTGRIEFGDRIVQFWTHPTLPTSVAVWAADHAYDVTRQSRGAAYWHSVLMPRDAAREVADLLTGHSGLASQVRRGVPTEGVVGNPLHHVLGVQPPHHEPARMGRGRPVRFATPQDVAGLWETVKASPLDQGAWGVLADALDESGHGHLADATRAVHRGRAVTYLDGVRRLHGQIGYPERHDHLARSVLGSVAGIPLTVGVSAGDMSSTVRFFHADPRRGHIYMGTAVVPKGHAVALAHQLEPLANNPVAANNLGRWKAENPRPERFAAAQAGSTGLLSRGISYLPGQFTPAPMPSPPPPAAVAPKRTRLRELLRRPSMRLARPVLDPNFVRGLGEAKGDHAPWLGFADHLEEQGMPHLAGAIRSPEVIDSAVLWSPGESWERPDYMDAAGFPSWTTGGAAGYVDMKYYPEHGAASVKYKAYQHAHGITDPGNAERITVVRGHDRIHHLAAELEQSVREDKDDDWADEFEAIKNEAGRRAGTAHAQG